LGHQESLLGTAPHAERWLLVEYAGAWGAQALEESDLSAATKQAVEAAAAALPHVRVGLIKQTRTDRRTVFAIDCATAQAYRYEFDTWEDLASSAGPALFSGQASGAAPWTRRLYLVCTHGRRDRCCAEAGVPVYQALQAEFGQDVWQTTHTGGHRFAANLVCLPHGIVYGRIDPDSALKLARGYADGRIDLDHCRGRSRYAEAVQAAEVLYRQATGDVQLDSLTVAEVQEDDDVTRVVFQDQHGGREPFWVRGRLSTFRVKASCSKDKTEPVMQYQAG
jgi:hypothetical protein